MLLAFELSPIFVVFDTFLLPTFEIMLSIILVASILIFDTYLYRCFLLAVQGVDG